MLQPDQLDDLRRSALADSPSAQTSISLLEEPDHDELQAAETTHFVVIDGAGNIVSATQSLSLHFGAGMVVPGTGIVLNNTLSNFNTISGSPNEVAPGRRPRTTISPTIIVREGRPVAALGLPGGARIPSAVVQVVVDHLQFGTPLEAAIGAPRFHGLNRTNLRYETERETDDSLVEALHSRFNWQNETNEGTETFGGFNAAEILPDGRLRGFADQRRSNAAMGF
jgi:gamma-glutamyltranspeptidase/glutathione hydrolase